MYIYIYIHIRLHTHKYAELGLKPGLLQAFEIDLERREGTCGRCQRPRRDPDPEKTRHRRHLLLYKIWAALNPKP